MKKTVILSSFFAFMSCACFADTFPSEDELDGIIKGCSIGLSKNVKAKLSAVVKSWRDAAVKGNASYGELGAILNESKDGSISTENYKVYTSCIIELVKEFNNANEVKETDSEQPPPVLGSLIKYDGIEASSKFSSSIPSKAFDGNIDTVWHSTNRDKSRYILLKYRTQKEISKIRFYRNSDESWYSQIKEAILTFSDNSRLPIKLEGYNGWEEVIINPPKKTSSLKIQITRGTQRTNQLKISEIEVIGR